MPAPPLTPPASGPGRTRLEALLAFLLYLLLALLMSRPLPFELRGSFPSDPVDPALNAWILWWSSRTLPLGEAWWSPPAFHPLPGGLALSEHLLGEWIVAAPIVWVTGEPVLALNLLWLLSYPLAGLGAWLLGRSLTGRADAAFLGGLAFGFAPYRASQIAHLQMLWVYAMPLGLLGLHRYLETRRAGWLGLFGASWLVQGLSNGYLLLFYSVLVALWLAWFPLRPPRPAGLVGPLLAWLLAALPVAPIALGYRAIHRDLGLGRPGHEIDLYSADVAALLAPAPHLRPWGLLGSLTGPETWLFPGLGVVILLLLATGAWLGRPRPPEGAGWRRARLVLAAGGALASLAAASARFHPWSVPGLSVTQPDKPAAIAAALLGLWALTGPRFRDLVGRRSRLGFYGAAAALMWLLSLGPSPRLLGERALRWGPYALLGGLPGFDSLRVPARFWMLAVLCLSAAASLSFARLWPPGSARRPWAFAALVVLLVLDGFTPRIPTAPVPASSRLLEGLEPGGAVLELPAGGLVGDAAAMFRAIRHRHPVVNGYSGHRPPHYEALLRGLELEDPSLLQALAARGLRWVRVDEEAAGAGRWSAWLERSERVRRAGSEKGATLYELRVAARAAPEAAPGRGEARAAVAAIRVTPGDLDVGRRLGDGDPRTRWMSHRQSGREQLLVRLEGSAPVCGVDLGLGRFPTDFPVELEVSTSPDGEAWEPAWRGRGAGPALEALLDGPLEGKMRIRFPARQARYLRLRQRGRDPTYNWSVAELEVLGPAGAAPLLPGR